MPPGPEPADQTGQSLDLSTLSLKEEYRADDDPLTNFYIPALRRSVKYDRAAGYFTSQALQFAAQGIAGLIANGGRMRLITSPQLDGDDIAALREATSQNSETEILSDALERSVFEGQYLEYAQTDRFRCLAWMVEQGLLDIRIAYLDSGDDINPYSKYHEKIGILKDLTDNKIAFSGSINETGLAWTDNYESFDVFRTWEPAEEGRVASKQAAFDRLWANKDDNVTVKELPEAIESGLSELSPGTVDNKPALEMFFNEEGGAQPPAETDTRELWDHQQAAIEWWREHDYQGLFAMATGSGKTLTALRALRLDADTRLTVIVVPSKVLVDQWADEIREVFGPETELLNCSGETNWRQQILPLVDPFRLDDLETITDRPRTVLLTTIHTATSDPFQKALSGINPGRLQIAIDEVHRAGAPTFQAVFDLDAGRRIGLSATPDRQWDEAGTQTIYDYFGGHNPFEFTTEEAIENGYLTEYEYHPVICELLAEEYEEYLELSREIETLTAQISSSDSVSEAVLDKHERLLRDRARIKKRAARKPERFGRLLDSQIITPSIVFCEDTDQLEEIEAELAQRNLDYGVYTSTREKEQADAMYRFEEGFIDYLLAIKCLDEGIDVPDCNSAVIIASSRNEREFIQRRGRVLRQSEGARRAHIYDVLVLPGLNATPDDEHALRLIKQELSRANVLMSAAMNEDQARNELAEELDSYGRGFRFLAHLHTYD